MSADTAPTQNRAVVTGGEDRARTAVETIELVWNLRADTGISRVADVTDLDVVGIPVFNTYRPDAAPGNLTVNCGKGLSRDVALVSSLMEAVESHFGEPHGRSGRRLTTSQATAETTGTGARLVTAESLNRDFRRPYDPAAELDWFPARHLATGERALLPANAVFTPYGRPEQRFIAGNSDGLASGNTEVEAILHGLFELAERDAQSFGEVLKMGARVELGSLPGEAAAIVGQLEDAGIEVSVFWLQTPIGLPAVFAVGVDQQARHPMLINGGAGAALSARTALRRALTELAQSRVSVISGAREDFSRRFTGQRDQESFVDAQQRWADWADGWAGCSFGDLPDLPTGADADQALTTVADRFAKAGMPDIYVVSLTPESFPVSVVRVVVPGVEFVSEQRSRVGPRFFREARRRGMC